MRNWFNKAIANVRTVQWLEKNESPKHSPKHSIDQKNLNSERLVVHCRCRPLRFHETRFIDYIDADIARLLEERQTIHCANNGSKTTGIGV